MISPTGKGMRNDHAGLGYFRAKRRGDWHKGMDFLCAPGQKIVAPIAGQIIREAKPYVAGPYKGLLLRNPRMDIKLFYVEPLSYIIGKHVNEGDVIAIAEDISQKYPKTAMLPHVHMQIEWVDPEVFLHKI